MLNSAENISVSLRMITGVRGCMRHEQKEDRTLRPWDLWVGPGGLSTYQQVCMHLSVQQWSSAKRGVVPSHNPVITE